MKSQNGARSIRKDGYVVISGICTLEHVSVAEKAFGRKLPKGVIVHHANEDRANNKNSNLVICPNNNYHRLLHRRLEAFKACGNPSWIKCNYCKQYDDPKNLYIRTGKRMGRYGMRKDLTARHPHCAKKYMSDYYQRKLRPERIRFNQILTIGDHKENKVET